MCITRDANHRLLTASGAIALCVQSGSWLVSNELFVMDDLSVSVIVGCGVIDAHAHAILLP